MSRQAVMNRDPLALVTKSIEPKQTRPRQGGSHSPVELADVLSAEHAGAALLVPTRFMKIDESIDHSRN
jgi:hypothetical protein